MFSCWKKPPARFTLNEEAMRADMADYRALGFEEVATFACFLGKDYRDLYGDVDIAPFTNAIMESEETP
jgi:hypothetical protein